MSARKRSLRAIRRFIQAVQNEQPNAALADAYVRTATGKLFTHDLRTLLRSERAARREAAALSEAVAELQTENAALRNNVSELPKKISDPPGSHERWQALRDQVQELQKQNRILQSSYDHASSAHKKAEQTVRDMADQLRNLPTPAMWSKTQARVRELSEALSRAYAGSPSRQDAERLRAENMRLTDLLGGAHKDTEVQERIAASVPALRKLVEDRGRSIRELTAERDSLQRALSNLRDSVQKGAPEPEKTRAQQDAENLRDIRKIAEDILPQFLATFLPKDGQ